MFLDRKDGALQLARSLAHLRDKDVVVVAIPRGGVVTGFYIAEELHCPLSYLLVKKIGHPTNEEFAIGATTLHRTYFENSYDLPGYELERQILNIRNKLKSRLKSYQKTLSPLNLEGKYVIIIDDGMATGHTLKLAAKEVRAENPEHIVVAVPVASPRSIEGLRPFVDEVICLYSPAYFAAVGQFYRDFPAVSDFEVIDWLKRHASSQTNSKSSILNE